MDHLLTVGGRKATSIARTGLATEGLVEREHLQEWVIAHPLVLREPVLVITSEYDRWADTDGVPARDRLDRRDHSSIHDEASGHAGQGAEERVEAAAVDRVLRQCVREHLS